MGTGMESETEVAVGLPPCEHHYAAWCYQGMSVRTCQLCGEPDWDDLRGQLEGATSAAAWKLIGAAAKGLSQIREHVRRDDREWADVELVVDDVIGEFNELSVVTPEPVPPAARYALVEQLGHRSTIGAVREVTFCGEQMLEVTALDTGRVHLVSPGSLYEVTWMGEDEARRRAAPYQPPALPVGLTVPRADPWPADDEDASEDDEESKTGAN